MIVGAAAFAAVIGTPFIARTEIESADRSSRWLSEKGRLKIGLLWSLTGNLAFIEKTSRDVALYWVDKVNRDGGVAGLKIEPIVVDAKSDIKAYREGAFQLIHHENALAIFGGYTSASRRAIMPLVESSRGLLFYPGSYPGRECWQRMICTGPIANQHSFDLIPFMCRRHGMRVHLIGSNNVRSREWNRNAKEWLSDVGGEVVGESYIPVGQGDFSESFANIRANGPDWIFSTVAGESDLFFRKAYAEAGFTPDKTPTASLTTSEIEVSVMGRRLGEGHYASAPYFQSIASESNRRFVDGFLNSPFGGSGVTHYTMEETYLSLLYFQKSVENIVLSQGAAGLNPAALRDACGGMSLSSDESPEGAVRIDPRNFNSWLTPRIGRFNAGGQIEILFEKNSVVEPRPFALYPSRGECLSDGLHLHHGQIVRSAS